MGPGGNVRPYFYLSVCLRRLLFRIRLDYLIRMFDLGGVMKPLPTDLEILEKIYEKYYPEFSSYSKDSPTRSTKNYVPIDIEALSEEFGVDGDILFGRLYSYLEKKHGYKQDDGAFVHFFTISVGSDRHAVNFPLLSSVLADLQDDHRRFRLTTIISASALVISIISIAVSIGTTIVSFALKVIS